MPAPKGNKNAVGNKGGGRPSAYRPEFTALVEKLAKLGATDEEIADVLGVSETTLGRWKRTLVEFSDALKRGKILADANVADRLYQRALGFEHDDVDIRVVGGKIRKTKIRKIYPPDTAAAFIWLKNRRAWRDKADIVPTDEPPPKSVTVTVQDASEPEPDADA